MAVAVVVSTALALLAAAVTHLAAAIVLLLRIAPAVMRRHRHNSVADQCLIDVHLHTVHITNYAIQCTICSLRYAVQQRTDNCMSAADTCVLYVIATSLQQKAAPSTCRVAIIAQYAPLQ
eukprot:6771-Heterococcus_DN1.PRE.1